MRAKTGMFIIMLLAIAVIFQAQPASADSACSETDFFACAGVADDLDPTASGSKVFGTVTGYYEPVFDGDFTKPECWENSDVLVYGCPDDEISNVIFVIRLQKAGKTGHYFISMDQDDSDPCDGYCICMKELGAANSLPLVPLCSAQDADTQFELFVKAMENDALPKFLETEDPVSFTLKSFTNATYEGQVRPYYLVFDFIATLDK